MTSIRAAMVIAAVAMTAGGPIEAYATAASSKPGISKAEGASDFGSRRSHRRHGHRIHVQPQPRYYARPYYYRPYPYAVAAPFTFGIGFGPGWW